MPAYTHLQRAEPVLVAHWLLAYVEMLLRDATAGRLPETSESLPSGFRSGGRSYAPSGSSAMAADLDFAASTANSIDATGDRDFVLEFVTRFPFCIAHEPYGRRR